MVGATRKRPDHSRVDRPHTESERVVEQKNANGIEMGVERCVVTMVVTPQ